jgi:hypothetical protein
MADVLFVLLLVALFMVAVAFVRVCDRMLGADDVPDTSRLAREGEKVAA